MESIKGSGCEILTPINELKPLEEIEKYNKKI